jgi:hypothetical protein
VADDVMEKAAADTKSVSANGVGKTGVKREESRSERARRLGYQNRFAVFYVALAVVAGAGVGALLVLVNRGSPAPAPAWSAWEPTGSGPSRAAQIADHIGEPYRLPSGHALVGVKVGLPTVTLDDGTTFPIVALAVTPNTTGGKADESDIDTINANSTVMYTLYGLGRNGSIPEGKPSNARGQLLRREALELALYTFKYVNGANSALVLMPPRAPNKTATAVFLPKGDVGAELSRPLEETLTAPQTPGVGEIAVDEQRSIDRLTQRRLYAYQYLRAQDGGFVMVLTPDLGG